MPGIFVDTWVCVCWTELGEKKYPKRRKILKIFESESLTLGHGNLEKVMESWKLKSSKEYEPCFFFFESEYFSYLSKLIYSVCDFLSLLVWNTN